MLLKNETSLLPFTKENRPIKSIAIIGPDVKNAVISGGGSAALAPSYTVSPWDAVIEVGTEVLGLEPANIKYARGANAHKWAPLFVSYVRR